MYNRLLLRCCLFLTVFSVQVVVGSVDVQLALPEPLPAQKTPEINAQAEGPGAFLQALYGKDEKAAKEALAAMLEHIRSDDNFLGKKKREDEQRAAHLAMLPERAAQSVKAAHEAYEKLAKLLRVENALGRLCQELGDAVTQVDFEHQSDQQAILHGLGGLKHTLKNGLFKRMSFPEQLPGGPQAQLMKALFGKNEEEQFDRSDVIGFRTQNEDLRQRLEGLSAAISNVPASEYNDNHRVLLEKTEQLATILNAANARDSKRLSSECVQLLEPEFEAVAQKLTEAISVLVDARIQLASDADQKLKDALDYWLKHCKVYRKTINSFLSLASDIDIDLSFFLYSFSYVYDIASVFLRSKNLDGYNFELSAIVPTSTPDVVLRTVLAGLVILHTKGDIANQGVQGGCPGIRGYLLGESTLENFVNPFDEWEAVLPTIFTSMLVAQVNPTMYADRMHWVTRAVCRIVGSCFWHEFFGSEIFGVTPEGGQPKISLKDSKLLRCAVMETVREAQAFLDHYLERTLTDAVDPIILEEIEKFSMGLAKPELIHLSLEIAVPMIFLKYKNHKFEHDHLINFQNSDFFKHDFRFCMWLSFYKGGLSETDFNDIERFYAEYKLIHYACENLGKFWGATLTRELQIPVFSMLLKVGKITGSALLNFIDLFYPDDVSLPDLVDDSLIVDEDVFDDNFSVFDLLMLGKMRQFAVLGTEKGRIWLKKQVVEFFQEGSQLRMMGIQMLIGLGFLHVGLSELSPLDINYRMVATLLQPL